LTSPEALIELGASELGGISEKTLDYINPESPWPKEEELKRINAPYELRESCRYIRGLLKWDGIARK